MGVFPGGPGWKERIMVAVMSGPRVVAEVPDLDAAYAVVRLGVRDWWFRFDENGKDES